MIFNFKRKKTYSSCCVLSKHGRSWLPQTFYSLYILAILVFLLSFFFLVLATSFTSSVGSVTQCFSLFFLAVSVNFSNPSFLYMCPRICDCLLLILSMSPFFFIFLKTHPLLTCDGILSILLKNHIPTTILSQVYSSPLKK